MNNNNNKKNNMFRYLVWASPQSADKKILSWQIFGTDDLAALKLIGKSRQSQISII